MPDEDKTFSGFLVLDLRIWWRQVHTLYWSSNANVGYFSSDTYVSIIDVKHMDFFRRCDAFYTRSVPEHETAQG